MHRTTSADSRSPARAAHEAVRLGDGTLAQKLFAEVGVSYVAAVFS